MEPNLAKMKANHFWPFFSLRSKTPWEKHLIKASSLASVSQPDLPTVTSDGAAGSCQDDRQIDM